MSRICLGTAQFGMEYGIANDRGRVPAGEVKRILELAARSGIDTLDTAIVYGDSEAVLGATDLRAFHVVTKLPPLPEEELDLQEWVRNHAVSSCQRLRVDRLHGLLLHRVEDVHGARGADLVAALTSARDRGLTDGVGVSIYTPWQLDGLSLTELDFVQAPLNVFDQRLVDSGALASLQDAGIRVFARSALLQGVLVMEPEALPCELADLRSPVARFRQWAAAHGVSPLVAALGHVFATRGIHRVVLGIDGIDHLRSALHAEELDSRIAPAEFAVGDESLIDPRRWA